MHNFTHILVIVLLTLTTSVFSQAIDPSSVDGTTKAKWCTDQKSSCPLLCLQIPGATSVPRENTCTASTLVWSCVCSNGQSPNASEYSQTIPFYECQQTANTCVANCNGDSGCQDSCRTAHPCGAQNPTRVNSSTISSTMSKTAMATGADSTETGSGSFTGFGGSASSTGTSSAIKLAQPVSFGPIYGMMALLVGVFGGFALVL